MSAAPRARAILLADPHRVGAFTVELRTILIPQDQRARLAAIEDWFARGYYFGNDPRDDYTSKGYTQLGEPRRYGLTVNLDF